MQEPGMQGNIKVLQKKSFITFISLQNPYGEKVVAATIVICVDLSLVQLSH